MAPPLAPPRSQTRGARPCAELLAARLVPEAYLLGSAARAALLTGEAGPPAGGAAYFGSTAQRFRSQSVASPDRPPGNAMPSRVRELAALEGHKARPQLRVSSFGGPSPAVRSSDAAAAGPGVVRGVVAVRRDAGILRRRPHRPALGARGQRQPRRCAQWRRCRAASLGLRGRIRGAAQPHHQNRGLVRAARRAGRQPRRRAPLPPWCHLTSCRRARRARAPCGRLLATASFDGTVGIWCAWRACGALAPRRRRRAARRLTAARSLTCAGSAARAAAGSGRASPR